MRTVTWSTELRKEVKRLKRLDISNIESLYTNPKTQDLLASPIEKEAVYMQFIKKGIIEKNNATIKCFWG